MASSPDELRRWVHSRRAAEERELSEARTTVRPPDAALRAALSLIALARARHGWPLPADPRDEEEDMLAYDRWARLRRLARR
jgi:hypothetical protein